MDEGGSGDLTRHTLPGGLLKQGLRVSIARSKRRGNNHTRSLPIHARFSVQVRDVFQLTNRLRKTMTDIMNRNQSHESIGPFEEEGFNQGGIYSLNTSGLEAGKALDGAVKIKTTCKNRGEIETDSAVENSVPVATEAQPRAYQYYSRAGPVASTHEDLRWRTTWKLADDAPAYKSDAWNAEASQLEIPERDDLSPKLVRRFYAYLEEIRDRDDRPAHREELIGEAAGIHARERQYDTAFRFLKQFDGIEPPAGKGPAWEYVGEEP